MKQLLLLWLFALTVGLVAIGAEKSAPLPQESMTTAVVVGVPLDYAADYFKDGPHAPPRCEDIEDLVRPYPWTLAHTTGFYCVVEVVVQ